jgi:NADH dehydrogenase [ubiquinone] 1 alpha subcomplex assembly factor 7
LRGFAPAWHDAFDDVPPGPAIVIANEFFDALPVEQHVRTPEGWRLRCVGIDGGSDALAFVTAPDRPAPDGLIPPEAADAPVGAVFEHCPTGIETMAAIGRRIAGDGIAALAIDYGHARRGAGETLQAVRRHRRHDVLADPGDADLTAHVDFEALAGAAASAGATPWGPAPQGAFLAGLGIEARTARLAAEAGENQAARLWQGCRRLIAADGMGTLFKVLALTRTSADAPAGFELQTAGAQES